MRISIYFAIIMILGLFYIGIVHEQVHVIIYKSYGIESKVNYFSDNLGFVTNAESTCPTEECKLAHHINEAITYVLTPFYAMIGLGIFFILTRLEEIK